MTKSELIKEIERYMESIGAMVCIENLNINVRAYPYGYVYGVKFKYGTVFFTSDPYRSRGDILICPVKWDKFSKKDLQDIYERMKNTAVKIYSRKTDCGYDFYKIWE